MNLSGHGPSADDELNLDNEVRLHRGADAGGIEGIRRWPVRLLKALGVLFLLVVIAGVAGFFYGRHWMQTALRENLPVVDGQVSVNGLSAPVTVTRDAQGVPHIAAASMEDLVFAQGYITAGDRLWQMDALRRHAAGELAAVLGSNLVEHDRMQRTLQLRAAADRALAVLPADQMHWLNVYVQGVNASIAEQKAHLPLEFKVLRYEPAPWTPRDSLLVGLAMFQDLTTTFPEKLDREALSAKLSPELAADLYPVGSWRDHPAGQAAVDLTAPQPEIEQVPLDESQSSIRSQEHLDDLMRAKTLLARVSARYACEGCASGSNGWAVAGAKTKSGKPMLSSDMHLSHGVPGIWYMADLSSGGFHVSGVTLPGTPFVIVGHNQHVAWGFTNLGADVQDLYVEQTRGMGDAAEFEASDRSWHKLLHQREVIAVKGAADIVLDVTSTEHGGVTTPLVSGLYPHEKRSIALRWTVYDPANVTSPFYAINAATDWQSICAAAANFGGPAQNMQYADDQGHIGYHAIGRVPVRGSMSAPAALSPVPADGRDVTREWVGYIPFEQMPQAYDPPGGFVATANARVVPNEYPFPVTLDWASPYRNERIWKVLSAKTGMVPADMLQLQTDVYSDLDKVIAQRLAYAIDHSASLQKAGSSAKAKRLRQAADLMRVWDGTVEVDSAAPAIVDAARAAFWPLILEPQLGLKTNDKENAETLALYGWGEKQYAEEQIIMHEPARWLPVKYADWNELLTAAVEAGLDEGKAPHDLSKWEYGRAHPVDIEHPIYSQSPFLGMVLGMKTGTGVLEQSGDTSTVKQVGRKFGPSERLTVDFSDLDDSTLNVVLGQSANPASEWFMDQWPAWYHGTTFAMPFSDAAVKVATRHTLTLVP
jgi:penicillin amidase